jgi:hypothetical protein
MPRSFIAGARWRGVRTACGSRRGRAALPSGAPNRSRGGAQQQADGQEEQRVGDRHHHPGHRQPDAAPERLEQERQAAEAAERRDQRQQRRGDRDGSDHRGHLGLPEEEPGGDQQADGAAHGTLAARRRRGVARGRLCIAPAAPLPDRGGGGRHRPVGRAAGRLGRGEDEIAHRGVEIAARGRCRAA